MEKYYKTNENTIGKIRVERDDEPLNPRTEDDGNIGHMMCWHPKYALGDKNPFNTVDEFFDELITQEYTKKQLVNMAKNRKIPKLEIAYNRETREYSLIAEYTRYYPKKERVYDEVVSGVNAHDLYDLFEDVLEYMNNATKMQLLEEKGYVFLPLSIYDHSGITMYVGGRLDHYDGQWDCSDVGWIYTTKKEVMESGCRYRAGNNRYYDITENNWKKASEIILKGEVEIYDQYLVGDVYGFIIEEYDKDSEDWQEVESVWGYYSDKWGDDLVQELASEAGITEELVNDVVKLIA